MTVRCKVCEDTHVMPATGYMCTHCPVPCEACRSRGPGRAGGPYCARIPCTCACHSGKAQGAPTDYVKYANTLHETLECARAWEPDVRLLGNVRAGDMAGALEAAAKLCAAWHLVEELLEYIDSEETGSFYDAYVGKIREAIK